MLAIEQLLFGLCIAIRTQKLDVLILLEHQQVKANALRMVPFTFVFALYILVVIVLFCTDAVLSFISVLHHNAAAFRPVREVFDCGL